MVFCDLVGDSLMGSCDDVIEILEILEKLHDCEREIYIYVCGVDIQGYGVVSCNCDLVPRACEGWFLESLTHICDDGGPHKSTLLLEL